jgi:hypothetical protein
VALSPIFEDDEVDLTEAFRVGDEVDAGDPVSVGGEGPDDPEPATWYPDRRRRVVEQRAPSAAGIA